MDIMLDLETLGTKPDCAILTFGAVKFNPHSSEEPHSPVYHRLNSDFQTEVLGRTIDEDTIEWWSKQEPSVMEEAFSEKDRINIDDFISIFNKYIVGVDRIWCHGLTFDAVILENLYRSMKKPFPINYWMFMDSRTLFKILDENPIAKFKDERHNSLADAYYQAIGVQQVVKKYNI